MAATQNNGSNGFIKFRLKTAGVVLGITMSLLAIGTYAYSYAQTEARNESRLAAVEKMVVQHETALLEVKGVVAKLQLSVTTLNTHLEWLRKESGRGRKP